jgi:hypothetical protein
MIRVLVLQTPGTRHHAPASSHAIGNMGTARLHSPDSPVTGLEVWIRIS